MAAQALISGVGRQHRITNPADPSVQSQLDGTAEVDQSFGAAWSGGPVMNLGGQAVGILVHAPNSFVIPSDAVRQEVQTFLTSGQLVVPSLGVTAQYVNSIQAAQQGAVAGEHVTGVTPGGPAALAGLQSGDILTTLDTQRLTAQAPLSVVLRQQFKPSQKVTVGYERAGARREVQVTLGQEVPSC
ncbi:MAG: PDZ domain-containing protein, partial [Candidatus Dormibacteraeota bacterium]|nr:PDZ domain-containing protein [Candidatus Dormibacteraeota bacterium]